MKLLITTRADSNISEWTDITHPIIKEYANRVGADFKTLSHKSDCNDGDGRWHYRIFKHKELHKEYDRILHIDSDVLLTPNCPNIFDVVPYEKIGTIFEDKGSRRGARHQCIADVQSRFGDVGWESGYINTGVFVTSKCHEDIYEKIDGEYWVGFGFDDVHMGYLINKYKYTIHELPYQWNHMTMFSEPWNGSADRFKSHVIHYAGRGVFDSSVGNKVEQLKKDNNKLYE